MSKMEMPDRGRHNLDNLPAELIKCVKEHNPQWIVYFTPMLTKSLHFIWKRYHGKHTNAVEAVAYTRRCLSKAAQLGKFGVKSNGIQRFKAWGSDYYRNNEGFIIDD